MEKKNEKKSSAIPADFEKLVADIVPKLLEKKVPKEVEGSVPNFLEVESVEEANQVDLTKYSFIGIRQDKYVFKIRQR